MRPDTGIATKRMLNKLMIDLAWPKYALAVSAGVLDYFVPLSSQPMLLAVAIALVLDTITGFMAAWTTHTLISSRAFSRVLVKVVGYGSCVMIGSIITQNIPGVADFRGATVAGILTLILLTESISVLENVAKMGVPLPIGLLRRLRTRLRDDATAAQEDAVSTQSKADKSQKVAQGARENLPPGQQ